MIQTKKEREAFSCGISSVEHAYSIRVNSVIESPRLINKVPQITIWYKDRITY